MEITGAIFDCDGTLVDSMGMWSHACDWLAARHDAGPVPFDRLEALSLRDTCAFFHDELGVEASADELYEEVCAHVRDAYNLAIGERTAEDIKIKVGSAVPLKDELDVEVNGRDVISGLPKTVRIESEEIRRALNKPLDEMTKAVKEALDATPPDLASDLMYYGILLTGGGALLRGLDVRLRDETGVAVNVSPTALDNVVNGCARVLEANAFDGGFVQSNA